jgi:hypothetical protein
MTAHDYLVLAIAAFWMVVGGLGLGFTIRHLHHQDGQQRPAVVGHDPLSAVRWQIPNIGGGIFDALAERRIGILGPVIAGAIAGLVAYALFLPGRHSAPEVRSLPSAQTTLPLLQRARHMTRSKRWWCRKIQNLFLDYLCTPRKPTKKN